jgi:hypothetical protein
MVGGMPRRNLRRKHPDHSGHRPTRHLGRHTVAESDDQILLGRLRADSGADAARRGHGPLRRRRRRLLRHSAFSVAALQRDPDVARQMGLFWIATAWLAAGLFIGPLVSEHEPKGQRLGVNILFARLLLVVVGSLAGEWLSIHNKMSDECRSTSAIRGTSTSIWGECGRSPCSWDCCSGWCDDPSVAAGLAKAGEQKQLVTLLAVATAAIALFYGAGLTWGRHTHLSMVEYWRWWVVHLWVEGFFEVFATTVIAFFFMRLNLIGPASRPPRPCCRRRSSCRAESSARATTCTSPARRPCFGLGFGVQCPGGRAAGPGGIRRDGRPASVPH